MPEAPEMGASQWETLGEGQGWGALVGVGFACVDYGFMQEKENSQDDWRSLRPPPRIQSPHCGFPLLGERKRPKGSGRKWLEAICEKIRNLK